MQLPNRLRLLFFFVTTISAIVTHRSTQRIRVDIGSNGAPALVFTPDTIKAQAGDTLDFHFIDQNIVSSVLLGVETSPCTPAPAGPGFFNSGPILGNPNGVSLSPRTAIQVVIIGLS